MPYAPLDDRFDDCAKYFRLDLGDLGLIAAAITYATRNLTDGVIPREWPGRRFGREGDKRAARLVVREVWTIRPDGDYEIVGFLDHNPSKAEVMAKKAKRAEAGKVGGLRSGQTRRVTHPVETYDEPAAEANGQAVAASRSEANAKAPAEALASCLVEPTTTTLQLQIDPTDRSGVTIEPHESGTRIRRAPRAKLGLIPPNWSPRAETVQAFAADGVDALACVPEFVDFWVGEGKAKADWDATFRNRVRTLVEQGRAPEMRPKGATAASITIHRGMRIRTAADGSKTVELPDGTQVPYEPNAQPTGTVP